MAELKNNIDKFFSDLSSGTTWNVGVSIARKNAFPLDNTSVFKSLTELNTYTQNGMAYMGQPVAVVNEDGSVDFYVLDANKAPQEVGKATVGDDKSITLDNGVLKLFGFDSAPDGAQLSKSGNKLVWALPDTTTADGQSAAIAALQAIVNGTVANPETGAEATDGLVQKVAKNTTDIKANADAIAILNGASTVEGSVAYQIAQIVEASDNNSVDTLKEIAAWIADHPESVAEINKDIKANADAIKALEELVGSTAVATQITNAISAALKVDGVDKYALASDLTNLAGRVSTAEGKITTIENAIIADPLHSHANKAELDKIAADDVSKWNTAASDVASLKSKEAADPLHSHGNKSVLDGITSEKVAAWDSAKADAITYTQGYAAKAEQGELADTALQTVNILGINLTKGNHTLTEETIKEELGLGSAAYANTTAFDAAGSAAAVQGEGGHTVKEVYDIATSKATMDQVNTAISSAGHASESDLTAHTGNNVIHVTKEQKDTWNAAVAKLEDLTGEDLSGSGSGTGGISAMIETAIDEYDADTIQPALTGINTKLNNILGTSETDIGRLGNVEKVAAENAAEIATIKNNVADNDTDIEKAKSDISALQTASAKHALADDVTAGLAAKADKEAYEATAATVNSLKATVDKFFNETGASADVIDTLKDITDYIANDESGTSDLVGRVGAIETKLEGVEKVSTAISSAVSAEETRALAAEATLSGRIKDLEDNKAGYATTGYVDSKASAAQTAAETFASTKVNELAAGAVKKNTDNIALNTAAIEDLGTTKANAADVYKTTETYSKTEVDTLLANAEIKWGSF